ncbi:MAG: 4-(cytidine 5'-diphospho)-2-C-methyl-D-erythritol kinase [bacterium]
MFTSEVRIQAPAKINLFLSVLGRRDDGYHEIASIMQSVALYDTLIFTPAPPRIIEVECPGLNIPPGQNLAYQAAIKLTQLASVDYGASIRIKKAIPVAAGLAGGSSDAAAALMGLNKLWSLSLTYDELYQVASELGADVPFCLNPGTALAEGIGAKLTPLQPGRAFWVVLIHPDQQVSTSHIYQSLNLSLTGQGPDIKLMAAAIKEGDLVSIAANLYNDLEQVTVKQYPFILSLKRAMVEAGAVGTLMSGSGPTVFGLAWDKTQATSIAAKLREIVKEKVRIVETYNPNLQQRG